MYPFSPINGGILDIGISLQKLITMLKKRSNQRKIFKVDDSKQNRISKNTQHDTERTLMDNFPKNHHIITIRINL